jgi:hypothetical protein
MGGLGQGSGGSVPFFVAQWESSWWWGGVGGRMCLYKKLHQVKLFFPIFYFLGRFSRIQNFFQVALETPKYSRIFLPIAL